MRARSALWTTCLALIAGALLGACGASAPPAASGSGSPSGLVSPVASSPPAAFNPPTASNPPPSAGGPVVGNRDFVSTSVSGHQLVAGTRVTLMFRDATLTANAGCNTMGGEYHLAGTTLSLGQLAMTEMGCEQDRTAQDAWLAALLPGATVQIGETSLTLTKGDVKIDFVDRKTTNLPLEGTVWTVDAIVNGDAVSSVPPGVTATFILEGGKAAVYTGCNWGSVSATAVDGTIGFGPLVATARGCANDGSKQVEEAMQAVLAGSQPYLIDADSLTIGTPGKAALMFKGSKPVPSDPGPS